ncbi:hypothetical protein M8J77_023660 [Diaphorina citri]|nr:hypothetical protein M8J77_023660 [Diaphorina citri]
MTKKQPSITWPAEVLQTHPHPAVYIGDFNSHHELWKYANNDENGELLTSWSELNNTYLLFDAKDNPTSHSAAWNRGYNPDLCFVSTNEHNQPLHALRIVLSNFPRSQHRIVIVDIGISIPLVISYPRPRWNFKKADWKSFAQKLDKCLGWIPPTSKNYNRFCGAVIHVAKSCMPRGYRQNYIPGWNPRCEELLEEFTESGETEIGDRLLNELDAARRAKCIETVEFVDFKKSSRAAWSLLRKFQGNRKPKRIINSVTPNQIAAHIVNTSRSARDRAHTTEVKKKFKNLKSTCTTDEQLSSPFTLSEVEVALKNTK